MKDEIGMVNIYNKEMETLKDSQLIHDLQEFANNVDMNETGTYTKILDLIHCLQKKNSEQYAEIERLTEELGKATESLVTASRCFTRMETFYKDKCEEFETAKEKDATDSKQNCEKCRTYWLSKLDTQKARTAELQKQVEKLTEERETANKHDLMYWFNAYHECAEDCEKYVIEASDTKAENIRLQNQVDELTGTINQYISGELVSEDVFFQQVKDIQQAIKYKAKEIFQGLESMANNGLYQGKLTVPQMRIFFKEHYAVELES